MFCFFFLPQQTLDSATAGMHTTKPSSSWSLVLAHIHNSLIQKFWRNFLPTRVQHTSVGRSRFLFFLSTVAPIIMGYVS